MQNNNNTVIAVTGNEKDYLIKTTLANRIEANKKIDEGLARFFHNARIIQSDLKDILDMIKESGVICCGDMKVNYMDTRAFDYSVFYKLDSYRSKSLKFTPKLVDSMEKIIEQVHDTCHEGFAKIILPD